MVKQTMVIAGGGSAEIQDDFLEEVLEGEEVGGEIALEDPAQVDYQIQKIARLRKRQAQIEAFVAHQMGELQAYLERRLRPLQSEIDWRLKPLEIYVRDAHRKSDGRVKTLDLAHGKLRLRAERENVQFDEARVLAWCDEHAEEALAFIAIRRLIQKGELMQFVKETGEAVDSVEIVPPGEPHFHLEIKE